MRPWTCSRLNKTNQGTRPPPSRCSPKNKVTTVTLFFGDEDAAVLCSNHTNQPTGSRKQYVACNEHAAHNTQHAETQLESCSIQQTESCVQQSARRKQRTPWIMEHGTGSRQQAAGSRQQAVTHAVCVMTYTLLTHCNLLPVHAHWQLATSFTRPFSVVCPWRCVYCHDVVMLVVPCWG